MDRSTTACLALSEKGQDGRRTDLLCVWLLAAREGQPLSEALRLPLRRRAERPRHHSRVVPGSYPCLEGWFGFSHGCLAR